MANIKKTLLSPVFFTGKYILDLMLCLPLPFVRNAIMRAVFIRKVGRKVFFGRRIQIRGLRFSIDIGNNTVINERVLLDKRGGNLTIGNNVDIAQEVNIWTLEHDPHDDYHKETGGDVTIEDYVWIASRVTILPGVNIGRGAVVACNSVVTKDVAPMSIVGGIPAKPIGVRRSNLLYTLNE